MHDRDFIRDPRRSPPAKFRDEALYARYPGRRIDYGERHGLRHYRPRQIYTPAYHRRSSYFYMDMRNECWWDLGAFSVSHGFYAPYLGASAGFYFNYDPGVRVDYRYTTCRVSPFVYQSYYAYPWYGTYYYSDYYGWTDAVSYAPGFAVGFYHSSYGDSMGGIYFSYGYGGGVRLGSVPWVYSWYPYGGYQRITVIENYQPYSAYVAPTVAYAGP